DRDAVLQRQRREGADRIHQPADRAPFLGHGDEEFPRLAVVEESHGNVPFVPSHRKFVGEGMARGGGKTAERRRPGGGGGSAGRSERLLFLFLAVRFFRRRQGLAALRPVAVNRQRLQPQLPPFDVGILDILDGRFFGHVDRLRDRPREEWL